MFESLLSKFKKSKQPKKGKEIGPVIIVVERTVCTEEKKKLKVRKNAKRK